MVLSKKIKSVKKPSSIYNFRTFTTLIKSMVPKSYTKYANCVKKHCNDERKEYVANKDIIVDKMKKCFAHSKNKKSFRSCIKKIRKTSPEAYSMVKCAKKHCRQERRTLMKDFTKNSKKLKKTLHGKLDKLDKLHKLSRK
jgi:hypothetical protein